VLQVHHVVGNKNVLIMGVTSEYADEFIDRAIVANKAQP
jgi:hypothetical protein